MISKRTTSKSAKPPKRSMAELARLRKIRATFQQRRPSLTELVASGEYTDPVPQADYVSMLELAAELREVRQRKRLSLAAVAKRSGIDKAALSRIETGQNGNPTIGTLELIARSLGARLQFQLIPAEP